MSVLLLTPGACAQEGTETETKTSVEEATAQTPTETQTQADDSSQATPSGKIEKIEVTGSHIKRIDVEGPSPVLTLDRDYLDRSGYNNVGDVLRDTTVSSFGGERETALAGAADTGSSRISIRGFESDRVLVMLDGKRLPPLAGSSTVDLALIPMSAVESIEILKDGASAIYGSDALGGVINIKTKKGYDGASIELGYTTPDSPGGTRTDVKASYGKTFSKGEFLGVVQYRSNEETWSRDYDYAQPTLTWYSQSSSPGTWVDPTNGAQPGSTADPCPSDRVNPDNNFCTFDYSPYSQITPKIDQYNALLSGKYNIKESMSVFARGIYTHRFVTNQLAPPPDQFRDDTATGGLDTEIPQSVATAWGLPATGDLPLVRYRLVEEAGPRKSEIITDSYALQTGTQGYMGDTWEWEFSATHGVSSTTNEGVSGYANKQLLYEAALDDPTSMNIFAANKPNIDYALYNPKDVISSSMSTVNLVAFGEIFEMPAGPFSVAVGVSNAWQTYEQTADPVTASGAQWGGGVSVIGKGRRDFQSAYSEFSLPPFKGMEVQVAGRFDNYSDFGSTVNPKVGFRYVPLSWMSFRGSWGTGFRAPSLENLYQGTLIAYPFGKDPETGQEAQFETLTGGNQDLREERTNSFNIGTVLEFFRNFSLVVDYWETKQDNQVSDVSSAKGIRDIFAAEQAFGVGYLQGFGIDVVRNSSTNQVERIIAPQVNLASKEIKGIDFELNYSFRLFGNYRFRSAVNHSVIIELLEEPFPGLGVENRVGFAGRPHWRNNITLGLSNQTWDYSAVIRTIGEQNKSRLDATPGNFGKTRDHTELDLRVQYSTSWNGTFAFLVKNVLDTDRPQELEYGSNGFLNTDLYDPFGRAFGLTYRQDF